MKACTDCGEVKPLSDYHARENGRYRSKCKKCTNRDNLERYRNNPATRKAHKEAAYRYIVKQYGISVAEYNKMLRKQEGRCAICRNVPDKNKRLTVDHCHVTGQVRGLLCGACNTGIGMFKDDANVLTEALAYLCAGHGDWNDAMGSRH